MNRLPYVISYKAGHTEKTVDEEFVEYLSQFDELKALSVKLHDAAKKYKDAAASMLKHQESFAKTLAEVYEPISGQKFGGNAGLSGVDFSKKSRALTNEDAMQVVHAYHEAAVDASAKLVPEMVGCDGCGQVVVVEVVISVLIRYRYPVLFSNHFSV